MSRKIWSPVGLAPPYLTFRLRRCAGRSFEVTPHTIIDEVTGQATLKPDISFKAGKSWHDIQGGF